MNRLRSSLSALRRDRSAPLFVVGHPRSGTTLVQTILAVDGAVSSGPETHFFTYVWDPTALAIPHHLLAHGPDKPTDEDPLTQLCDRLGAKPSISLGSKERAAIADRVGQAWDDPAVVLDAVMRALAPSPRIRWLEKTPRHVFALDAIWDAFPSARVINVVRDPRSVVASGSAFAHMEAGPKRLEYCVERAKVWQAAIQAGQRDDARLHQTSYDALITDPGGTVTAMAHHCGLKTDASTLLAGRTDQVDQVVTEADAHRKDRVAGTELEDRRHSWRTLLTAVEVQAVAELVSPEMERYGYD